MPGKELRSKANPAVPGPTDVGFNSAQKYNMVLRDGQAEVVAIKAGSVTTVDKLKSYYKFIIAFVGSIIVLLNEITPISSVMFGPNVQHWVSGTLMFLTSLSVFLKSNEHWVNG